MNTRSKKAKTVETQARIVTVEDEYLENKIAAVVKSMRKFGIQNCYKCGVELEYNRYAMKGSRKGNKYLCIPCDNRHW